MIQRLLSYDPPRSRLLAVVLVLMLVALAAAPFLFPGSKALGVAAKMLVFVLLVASYDLLLGYTGIVSFAHTMFFGIGAYGVAIALSSVEEASFGTIGLGVVCALLVSTLLSLLIALSLFTAAALDFIDRQHKAGKPFFCWWNSTRMHIWTHLKKRVRGQDRAGPLPRWDG